MRFTFAFAGTESYAASMPPGRTFLFSSNLLPQPLSYNAPLNGPIDVDLDFTFGVPFSINPKFEVRAGQTCRTGCIGPGTHVSHVDYYSEGLGVELVNVEVIGVPGARIVGESCYAYLGTDTDHDGWDDSCDKCVDTPSPDQADTDDDAVGDACDNCPTTANAKQANADTDSLGDLCDNCPHHFNPDQADCDDDRMGDVCTIAELYANDCQNGSLGDGVPDNCQLVGNDCNSDEVPDECNIGAGISPDCQRDGIPDECQLFENNCNANTVPDECDIASGTSPDCQGDGIPDECNLDLGPSRDCNTDRIPDECQLVENDCDANLVPDDCERSWPRDLNADSVVDLTDYQILNDCVAGPDVSLPPDGCGPGVFSVADLDGDGAVTLSDFGWLQLSFGTFLYFGPDCCKPRGTSCHSDDECCSRACDRGSRECKR